MEITVLRVAYLALLLGVLCEVGWMVSGKIVGLIGYRSFVFSLLVEIVT